MEKFENLQRLQELKEKGVITEQEFETEKSKILNSDNVTNNKAKTNKKNENVFTVCVGLIIGIIVIVLLMKMGKSAAMNDLSKNYENEYNKYTIDR